MHLQSNQDGVTSASRTGFRPSYNLFRRNRRPDLLCAVPQDCPVPTFVDGQDWQFSGTVDELSLGLEREAARAVLPLTGFYLFTEIPASHARRPTLRLAA
jgi:hypothetical protein